MNPDYSGEEFVGYLFRGPPERRPRLWFLQRHLDQLFQMEGWAITNTGTGLWTVVRRGFDPVQLGPEVRYEDVSWTAVWRLTGTTIPRDPAAAARGFGIHTFGRDDDVWRLGVWPD